MSTKSRSYNSITIGESTSYEAVLTKDVITKFAEISGDHNLIHLDKEFASKSQFKKVIGHGMWLSAIVSGAIYNTIVGDGGLLRYHSITFLKPTSINDKLEVKLVIDKKEDVTKMVILDCKIYNQMDELIAKGVAKVIFL